jgi:hypothetical protein
MPKEFDSAVTTYVREHLPSRLNPTQTVKEQAARIGVSDATLHDVLHGNATVGKKTIGRFAAALSLTVETLRREAEAHAKRRGANPAPVSAGAAPTEAAVDTLEMARQAARDLAELDGVRPLRAWAIMRDIRLDEPNARAFYIEARKRLGRGAPKADGLLGLTRKSAARRKAKQLFEGPDDGTGADSERAQK